MTTTETTVDELRAELDALRTERDKLAAKNRELLGENRGFKDQVAELTAASAEQGARLRRYELDGPIERVLEDVAVPGCERLWRTAFEQRFEFRQGSSGVEIVTRDGGEPAILPPKPGVKGRERPRPALLETADLIELASAPEFLPITRGSRGSGSGAIGSHRGRGRLETSGNQQQKGGENPPQPPLGLR